MVNHASIGSLFLALVFIIVIVAAPGWSVIRQEKSPTSVGATRKDGLFGVCFYYDDPNPINGCYKSDSGCHYTINGRIILRSNCTSWNVVRGFSLIALFITVFALIVQVLISADKIQINRNIRIFLTTASILILICLIITFAVFIDIFESNEFRNASYGYCFYMAISALVFPIADIVIREAAASADSSYYNVLSSSHQQQQRFIPSSNQQQLQQHAILAPLFLLVVWSLLFGGGGVMPVRAESCSYGCTIGTCICGNIQYCDKGSGNCILGVCEGECKVQPIYLALIIAPIVIIVLCCCWCCCRSKNREVIVNYITPTQQQPIQQQPLMAYQPPIIIHHHTGSSGSGYQPINQQQYSQFKLFFPLLFFIGWGLITNGPSGVSAYSSSCVVGSPSAGDACCNLGIYPSKTSFNMELAVSDVYPFMCQIGKRCVLCGTMNAKDTVDAQKNQDEALEVTNFFQRYNCWSGEIARTPGSFIESLTSAEQFYITLSNDAKCNLTNADLTFNGAWGDWSSSCVQNRIRLCNNPPPTKNGTICTGNDIESSNIQCPASSVSEFISGREGVILFIGMVVGGVLVILVRIIDRSRNKGADPNSFRPLNA